MPPEFLHFLECINYFAPKEDQRMVKCSSTIYKKIQAEKGKKKPVYKAEHDPKGILLFGARNVLLVSSLS